MPTARPDRKPGMRGGLRDVRCQKLGRFVSPEDELPAGGTKLLERQGWICGAARSQMGVLENGQRELDRPPGHSFLRTIATDADVIVVLVSAR